MRGTAALMINTEFIRLAVKQNKLNALTGTDLLQIADELDKHRKRFGPTRLTKALCFLGIHLRGRTDGGCMYNSCYCLLCRRDASGDLIVIEEKD